MMVVGFMTKQVHTGQDEITYWTLIFKVKITVTLFLYATLCPDLIHIHAMY